MEAYERILEVTGATTQAELASILDIKQSSVSMAVGRTKKIPPQWLLTLLDKYGVNPRWVTGESPNKYMVLVANAPELRTLSEFSTSELLKEIERRTKPKQQEQQC